MRRKNKGPSRCRFYLTGDFSLLKLNGQIARQLEDSNEAGEEFYRALSESGLFVTDTASRIHKIIHFNNFFWFDGRPLLLFVQ